MRAGWLAYSLVTKDIYVFLANWPGQLIGLYFTIVAYGFADATVSTLKLCNHAITRMSVLGCMNPLHACERRARR
jgi:hypothetical protein